MTQGDFNLFNTPDGHLEVVIEVFLAEDELQDQINKFADTIVKNHHTYGGYQLMGKVQVEFKLTKTQSKAAVQKWLIYRNKKPLPLP